MKKVTIVKLIILTAVLGALAWYYKGFITGFLFGVFVASVIVYLVGERSLKKTVAKKFTVNQALQDVIDALQ